MSENLPPAPSLQGRGDEDETAAAILASPFAGLEVAFACDLDPERFDFTMMERDCFVEIAPMDASSHTQFSMKGLAVTIDPVNRTIDKPTLSIDVDSQQLDLLEASVVDFALPRRARIKGTQPPQYSVSLVVGANLGKKEAREFFRKMEPKFRNRLVALCARVNHLDPTAVGVGEVPAGTPTSARS